MPSLRRRHPRSSVLSEYLDGELELPERVALERHLRHCPRCTRVLESLARTVGLLAELHGGSETGLADSIIRALRDEHVLDDRLPTRTAPSRDPVLSVVRKPPQIVADRSAQARPSGSAHGWLRYCLERPQLRLALPVAVLVGAALSLTDQGAMLLHRQLDVATCVGLNLLTPFIVLNVMLLITRRALRRRRLRLQQR